MLYIPDLERFVLYPEHVDKDTKSNVQHDQANLQSLLVNQQESVKMNVTRMVAIVTEQFELYR